MVRVPADNHPGAGDRFLQDLTANKCRISSLGSLESKRLLVLLVQQLEQLPPTGKKILAMYYHEDFKLSEIAARLGLSECQIDGIRTQTVGLLENYLLSASSAGLQLKTVEDHPEN
jgi:DNA-directed RNA polymerase specialized sigma subunit